MRSSTASHARTSSTARRAAAPRRARAAASSSSAAIAAAYAREAREQELEVLVAVEVPGVADEPPRPLRRRPRTRICRRRRGRDAGEPVRGDTASTEDLTQLLAHRDAEVGATRDVLVDE